MASSSMRRHCVSWSKTHSQAHFICIINKKRLTRALNEEKSRKTTVMFPIQIDDAVLNTSEAWARGLCIQRNIGDFRRWKDHDAYEKALERVLRDLKVTQAAP
jgi:hypothetical protein